MADWQTTGAGVPSETPLESTYRRIIVPLVRATTAFVVVVFILGGVLAGIGVMDAWYGEEPQLDIDTGRYSCYSEERARPGDTICRYATPVALFVGASGGGAVGLAAGLIATFSVEVGVTVYLAARKYLRS